MLPVKRSLFQTPTRSRKRSRTTKRKQTMVIPKSMLPETKQKRQFLLTNTSTNYTYSSIPTDMSQGDNADQFIGSKFRMKRLRVYYDFSQLSTTSGVRVSVLIPKDPSDVPTLTSTITPWDTNNVTVLHDMLLPDAPETAAGTFDVTGPINVELNALGTTPLRNNVILYVHATGLGTTIRNNFSYAVWFTDP